MKKVFLTLALVALVAVSCNKVTPSSKLTTVDSTAVQVDSVSIRFTLKIIDKRLVYSSLFSYI